MRRIEFFLALRFLKEGKSQTALIFSGAAAGVAVIVFLTSLITGLQSSLIEQTTGLQAHIVVQPEEPREVDGIYEPGPEEIVLSRVEPRPRRVEKIDRWEPLVQLLERDEEVVAAAPVAFGSAAAVRGQLRQPIELRGVEEQSYAQIIDVADRLLQGHMRLADQGTVIGYELADELGVTVGEQVRFVVAEGESRSFTVQGIFDLGAGPPNQSWAFVSMRQAQSMLDLEEGVSAVQATVVDLFDSDEVARRLQGQTEHDLVSWQETSQDLLRALRTQSASTFLIAIFVAIAVALGIASVLVVTVVQKRGQVGVLRAMGASMGTVLRVFLIQGAVVGLVGSVFGSLLGTALALGFNNLVRDEAGEVIFPIEPSPTIFVMACLLATLTGLLAAVAPARRAARLDPADAITNAG